MKIIELPCYGIKVTLDDTMIGFGKIESGLSTWESMDPEPMDTDSMDKPGDSYNGAIDAIESLILAHAVAGVDIKSPAYIEGIETVVDAIGNNI